MAVGPLLTDDVEKALVIFGDQWFRLLAIRSGGGLVMMGRQDGDQNVSSILRTASLPATCFGASIHS